MTRGLQVVFCALLLTLTSSPAWGVCRPENRVWKIFSESPKTAAADLNQTLEPRGESAGCGYDFASGVHKYLYVQDNPVNGVDPSGEMTIADTSSALAIGGALAALSSAVIIEAKTHAIGNLMVAAYTETWDNAGSTAAAAESALSVARTSTRDLIKKATDILKKTGRALKKVKVVPVPRSIIHDVADHVAMAQASGQPVILERVTRAQAKINRRAALAGRGPAGLTKSWDEYPFASGRNPLFPLLPSVVAVPRWENSVQGGIISACYTIEGISVGTPYVVVVTP